jgi:hypothetical protein
MLQIFIPLLSCVCVCVCFCLCVCVCVCLRVCLRLRQRLEAARLEYEEALRSRGSTPYSHTPPDADYTGIYRSARDGKEGGKKQKKCAHYQTEH